MSVKIQCPHCKKPLEWSEKFPFRPFCCERCKLIDLGAWADGSYSIPVQSSEQSEELSSLSDGDPNQDQDSDASDQE